MHWEALKILELYKTDIKIIMISILFKNIRRWTVSSEYWNLYGKNQLELVELKNTFKKYKNSVDDSVS